ncbi:FAD-dependent oxidoreductase [Nocardioides mangrovicus]|uniref:FAD-dependent oxidoreductase n=1 Tax=Nocardioides mangrovicus TaxID=2478913 RepID=A0A3L8P826_9ACTN|nr:FAD-dependent oxidoreductase [Nocardioides mangrovicus]RLV50538.1 FAD-dependent oxidoreductase [Nocardioides mangrovicus]
MTDVVVVGAGISGVACARALQEAGLAVRVLDRGHRVGGRMARHGGAGRPADVGASYLTVSDDAFAAVVDGWHEAGLARPWTDTFCVLGDDEPQLKQGPVRWGTPFGLQTLVEDLARGLEVTREDVAALPAAATVVLAMPDPQARRLVPEGHPLADRLDREFEPVLALTLRLPERTWDTVSPSGHFDGAFVSDHPALAWVADDGRRRGDDAPVLVAHSTASFARQHLADPNAAALGLQVALQALLRLPEPTYRAVQRWTYARPVGERDEPFALVDGIGVCGDGWGASPKVETAWLSGHALGRELAQRLA